MSFCSGKCDLYDTMSMCALHPSEKNSNTLVSDDLEAFEVFKKETGGVIYQPVKIELNDYNAEMECERNKSFLSREEHIEEVPDKRSKSGKRIKKYYTYKYFDKEMTLAQINQMGYWTKKEIHFDDILDLVPYFPYIIGVMFGDSATKKRYVEISSRSYVDEMEEELIQSGIKSNMATHYRKALKEKYIELVHRLDNLK